MTRRGRRSRPAPFSSADKFNQLLQVLRVDLNAPQDPDGGELPGPEEPPDGVRADAQHIGRFRQGQEAPGRAGRTP